MWLVQNDTWLANKHTSNQSVLVYQSWQKSVLAFRAWCAFSSVTAGAEYQPGMGRRSLGSVNPMHEARAAMEVSYPIAL